MSEKPAAADASGAGSESDRPQDGGASGADSATENLAATDAPTRSPLDADGRERPTFVLGFPDDPRLNELVAAFERGDFAYVRAHAEQLAKDATDKRVAAAAKQLRRRIDPDPLVVQLLLMALALLAFLIGWTYIAH